MCVVEMYKDGEKAKEDVCMLCEEVKLAYGGERSNLTNNFQTKHTEVYKRSLLDLAMNHESRQHCHLFRQRRHPCGCKKDITRLISKSAALNIQPIAAVDGKRIISQRFIH